MSVDDLHIPAWSAFQKTLAALAMLIMAGVGFITSQVVDLEKQNTTILVQIARIGERQTNDSAEFAELKQEIERNSVAATDHEHRITILESLHRQELGR